MNIENVDMSNALVVTDDFELGIDLSSFNKLLEKIRFIFKQLHLSFDDKSIYYERYSNKTSLLAIKLANGDDFDSTLYMFNGCDASSFEKYSSCDVYLHADKKVAQLASRMANLMSRDIVKFFEKFEKDLLDNGQSDSAFSLRIPIYEKEKKDTTVPRRLAKLFNGFIKKEK